MHELLYISWYLPIYYLFHFFLDFSISIFGECTYTPSFILFKELFPATPCRSYLWTLPLFWVCRLSMYNCLSTDTQLKQGLIEVVKDAKTIHDIITKKNSNISGTFRNHHAIYSKPKDKHHIVIVWDSNWINSRKMLNTNLVIDYQQQLHKSLIVFYMQELF